MSDNISHEITKVLTSGFISQGPQVEKFEKILKNIYLIITHTIKSK